MATYTREVAKIVGEDPNVRGVMAQMDGANGSAGTNQSRLMMISLKPLGQRKLGPDAIIRELRPKISRFPGVNVFLVNPPTIRLGARMARSSYQYTMQGLDLDQLKEYSDKLMEDMRRQRIFVDVNSDLDAAMPSVQVKIDRDRAAALGVSPQQIEIALGAAFGGQQISQINTSSNQYEVVMELLPRFQRDPSSPLCHRPERHPGAADRGGQNDGLHRAALGQPCRPDSGRHRFLRPGAGRGAVGCGRRHP
jgi:HAE1 family hydrophobic/amphiphilic exporter-1